MTRNELPAGRLLPQEEVQSTLARQLHNGAGLAETLGNLQQWSESVGYYDHLAGRNTYLSFSSEEWNTDLRLQVNYARIGYTPPTGDRPACPLCAENIGTPGKEKLRVYQFELNQRVYFAHLTPFPLHPGHFVVNRWEHLPMHLSRGAFEDAATFVEKCPGWLAASNSDLLWAGASVLQHHHFQAFPNLRLPIQDATALNTTTINNTVTSMLKWPCPSLRLYGKTGEVVETAFRLLQQWKKPEPGKRTCNFLMESIPHGKACLHIILRHSDHRTHPDLLPIKSEGVGIIEMAGELILPPRPNMTPEENRDYFTSIGGDLIPRLIGQNSPPPHLATAFFQTINWN
ncbi:MAG: hypothetical protein JJU11_14545 [Candidatus Sumerlaeia bacterium]|nr:hypothetical protein [Candidatus Sumerlaeia bacterium]